MKHDEIMQSAGALVAVRGKVYGTIRENHEQIAEIANAMTGLQLTPHNVLMIMVAVKLARLRTTPDHLDSYVDALNYLSFAGEIATDAGAEG